MKTKFLFTLFAIIAMCTTVSARQSNEQKNESGKILIAYFSATGTTANAAEKIAKVTGGELFRILPETAYSGADLNWNNKQSRSSVEMNDPKARPALKEKKNDLSNYDVLFLGYPIWWDAAPRIINSFIEAHDLQGKTIIPFATSGGSSISNSVKLLKQSYPDLNFGTGKLLNGASESTIREWTAEVLE